VGVIFGQGSAETSVIIKDLDQLNKLNQTYYAQIKISSPGCAEQTIDVKILTADFIFKTPESITEAIQLIQNFQNKPLFKIGSLTIKVIYLTLFSFFSLVISFAYSLKKSKTLIWKTIIYSLIITGIIQVIIYLMI